MTKTFSESGRGRKKCPSCSNYVGVKSNVCVCGHVFNKSHSVKKEKEIAYCDNSGPGLKHCPNCDKYVGIRNKKCHCGYEFKPFPPKPKKIKPSPPKKIIVYTSPGPKRKKCPDCEKFLKYNATECICGHQFIINPKKATVTKNIDRFVLPSKIELEASQFAQSFGQQLIIITPSGECPVKLNATDHETVGVWCAKVVAVGQQYGKIYAPSALRYFVREFFSYGTREYAMCCENIEEWVIQFTCGAA